MPNVKLKTFSRFYHVLHNNSAGKNTMSKCKCTEEFTRKLHALLYYVHMTMYNKMNCKFPHILIMPFYRLIWFHTRRRFHARLSVRVSDSGHPITYSRKNFTNNPGHKIYRCMPARYTWHYTLLHNPAILHTKTFFAPFCHPRKKILSDTKLSQYSLIHPKSPQISSSNTKYY